MDFDEYLAQLEGSYCDVYLNSLLDLAHKHSTSNPSLYYSGRLEVKDDFIILHQKEGRTKVFKTYQIWLIEPHTEDMPEDKGKEETQGSTYDIIQNGYNPAKWEMN